MGITPEHWMNAALALARQAETQGEVPVGAVVIMGDEIVGRGTNRTILDADPTAHAEVVALRDAASRVGNYRLPGAALYSTIEPCTMCAGAMVHARISHLFFGAQEPRAGAAGSTINVFENEFLNHRVEVHAGVCADEAGELMKRFFRARRQ